MSQGWVTQLCMGILRLQNFDILFWLRISLLRTATTLEVTKVCKIRHGLTLLPSVLIILNNFPYPSIFSSLCFALMCGFYCFYSVPFLSYPLLPEVLSDIFPSSGLLHG